MSLPRTAELGALPARPAPAPRLLRSRGLLGLMLLCGGAWLLLHALAAVGGPEAVRDRFGFAAALLLVPVHAVVAVSPFPSELIAMAHGAIYGFAIGWPLTWAGWCLGAALEYALYRRIASDVGAGGAERLPAWLRAFPVRHPLFLVLGRLVPFGNHAVNALAGSCRVPFGRFAWASALAFIPFSALIAGIASGLVRW